MPKVRELRRQICMYTGGTGRRFRTFTVLELPAARKKIPYSRHYYLQIVVINPCLKFMNLGVRFVCISVVQDIYGVTSNDSKAIEIRK